MQKQGAGQSETLQSLRLYFVSLLLLFSMYTTHLLLPCGRVKRLPENLPVGSRGNDLTCDAQL
jgi:hypothetical protein